MKVVRLGNLHSNWGLYLLAYRLISHIRHVATNTISNDKTYRHHLEVMKAFCEPSDKFMGTNN